MSDVSKILARGQIHSLTGLGTQVLVSATLIWLARSNPGDLCSRVYWTSLGGIVIWLHTLITFGLLKHEAQYGINAGGEGSADREPNADEPGRDRIRSVHRFYQRLAAPVMELGVAALLIRVTLSWLGTKPGEADISAENTLFLIAVYSAAALLLIIIGVYLTTLLQVKTWHLLKAGRNYTLFMVVMFLSLLVSACGAHFAIPLAVVAAGWVFIAVNTVLAAEIPFSMVLRFFSPRRPQALPRPAFDFYLLEALSHPLRIGQTFAAMLESILGFDITKTSFGKLAGSLVFPAIFLTAVLLVGLSSIVIVKPHEQAVVLILGQLRERPLRPGLHFKLPWPLATARLYNVSEVRSFHAGSHRPSRTGGSVYREGVPILWTNMHGYTIDELLICSSPQDMVKTAGQSGQNRGAARRVPSVSLAAADVQVQYVIKDLVSYVRSSSMPEMLLVKFAEAYTSRFIYRYDIDGLFCEARLELGTEIRRSLQAACDRYRLGVNIVHVSMNAVHPPVQVADAFEETVTAMQERETKIQHARQKAIREQVETTGSTETFARLSLLADRLESGDSVDVEEHERLLLDCGGEVSRILAEAVAYRFGRENVERGKTERFDGQMRAHAASPRNYRCDKYFTILEQGLAGSSKVVLIGDTDKTVLRVRLPEGPGLGAIPKRERLGF